jgi:hypothetical protein
MQVLFSVYLEIAAIILLNGNLDFYHTYKYYLSFLCLRSYSFQPKRKPITLRITIRAIQTIPRTITDIHFDIVNGVFLIQFVVFDKISPALHYGNIMGYLSQN